MVKQGCRADRSVGWYLTAQDGGHGCRGSAVATWETTAEGHHGQIREEMSRVRGEALPERGLHDRRGTQVDLANDPQHDHLAGSAER